VQGSFGCDIDADSTPQRFVTLATAGSRGSAHLRQQRWHYRCYGSAAVSCGSAAMRAQTKRAADAGVVRAASEGNQLDGILADSERDADLCERAGNQLPGARETGRRGSSVFSGTVGCSGMALPTR